MIKVTRRSVLTAVPLMSAAVTVPALSSASTPATDEDTENPALIAAYDEWRAAMDKLAAAKNDLEWLVDEWRHLWPLAPEEILGGANAGYSDNAERDMAGERIFRDTADLTKRLTKEFRQSCPRTCFFVLKAEDTAAHLEEVRRRKVGGRTEKSREANRRSRDRYIAELETRLRLAEDYEEITALIREQSGVEGAKLRVTNAKKAAEHAADAVSAASATTMHGVRLKAEVIVGEMERMFGRVPSGPFGDGYRLAKSMLNLMDA